MATSFNVMFNSGQGSTSYNTYNNLQSIQISNSDDSYYQTGIVTLMGSSNTYTVGTPINIYINGYEEFAGYVNRVERYIQMGEAVITHQIIGKTYDLWRYNIPSETFTSGTTAYIASSLVATYCTGISSNIDTSTGVDITSEMEFSDILVGDALKRLTEIDGYRFYVDSADNLNYYNLGSRTYLTSIEPSNIYEMSPIEETDEDILNDVVVIGTSGYNSTTGYTNSSNALPFYLESGMYIAQKFQANDEQLSGIDFYLNRSSGDYSPNNLGFEIWENSEKILIDDDFENYNYLNNSGDDYNMVVRDNYYLNGELKSTNLELDYNEEILLDIESFGVNGYGYTFGDIICQKFKAIQDGFIYKFNTVLGKQNSSPAKIVKFYIISGGGDYPTWNKTCQSSTEYTLPTFPVEKTMYFDGTNSIPMISGASYFFVISSNTSDNSIKSNNIFGNNYPYGLISYKNYGGSFSTTSTSDLDIKLYFKNYKTSGQIESILSLSDTKYLYLDISGAISSQKIFISGTNDSGSTWETLTDDNWTEFTSESSDGTKVRFEFSSNGLYTPKIDSYLLKSSDASGDFEVNLLNETFDNWDNISTSTNVIIESGYLAISGEATLSYAAPNSAENNYLGIDGSWSNYSNMYDEDNTTYAYSPTLVIGSCIYSRDTFTYNTPINIATTFMKAEGRLGTTDNAIAKVLDIWVSGTNTDGFVKVRDVSHTLNNSGTYNTGPISLESYLTGVKKVRYYTQFCKDGTGNLQARIYETSSQTYDKIDYNGYIETETISADDDIYFLKVDLTGNYTDNIYISGTVDGGSTWKLLSDGNNVDMQSNGTSIKLRTYIKHCPDGTEMTYYPNTPRLTGLNLYGYSIKGGGLPKSGSKIEWSDDISISDSNIPYPPQWTGWKSYSSPKLQLTENDYYWLIFKPTGPDSDYYWSGYRLPSTDNTNIQYSWNEGVAWSSNLLNSSVPSGNMVIKFGWKSDDIRATATNNTSITSYGRRPKVIRDSNITSLSQAQLRAALEVSSNTVPKKGSFTIAGRTGISVDQYISANLSMLGINEPADIVSYTHTINKDKGFLTKINYGKHQFDITKKISDLEKDVYGS